jgi:light-independent protochlorophyllide reductase subunit B
VNVTAPWEASPADLARLPAAWFNVVLYPEVAGTATAFLKRRFNQPHTSIVPIGVGATGEFLAEVAELAGVAVPPTPATLRLPWYARSVDATYLHGKRVFVFGDATHAIAAARVVADELGMTVCGLGSYSREFARELRTAAAAHGVEPLLADDYLAVEQAIVDAHPDLVLGTQMERHVAKRLGVPCAVISAPVHVQDFPARHSPQMGWEGSNVLFDTWVHPLMMGLEEHLLGMFREDFEFHGAAAPSHIGHAAAASRPEPAAEPASPVVPQIVATGTTPNWEPDAEKELGKIPFFVRGKARRNTEAFALSRGLAVIGVETLYDAKAHYAR